MHINPNVRNNIKYTLSGAATTFLLASMNLYAATTFGAKEYFFILPLLVGGIAGYLIGSMKFRLENKLSELKQTLQEVQLYKDAVNQAGDPILISGTDAKVIYVNKAFEDHSGYSLEELVGQNTRVLKSGNHDPEFYHSLWSVIKRGKTWQGKLINKKKDGSFYPVLMTVAPIIGSDGEIKHYIASQQPLDRHEALEEQFHEAQKMGVVGALVGGIAHNFNNLLAGIMGKSYLAKTKKTIGEVKPYLDDVDRLANDAAEMVRQLLSFSRKNTSSRSDVPVVPLIKEALKTVSLGLSGNIRLESELCNAPLHVYGIATDLQQVVMNLINNAHDAVECSEKKEIFVKLEELEWNTCPATVQDTVCTQTVLHLTVEDTGCGIRPGSIDYIFEPFYTTKEEGKGTGLGLSMVYGTIQSHGG